MSEANVYPKCKSRLCTRPDHYAGKHGGYCFDCHNSPVPDLEAELTRLRNLLAAITTLPSSGAESVTAAELLERLATENEGLKAALRPFAEVGVPDNWPDQCVLTWEEQWPSTTPGTGRAIVCYLSIMASHGAPTVADYRRAAAALSPKPQE